MTVEKIVVFLMVQLPPSLFAKLTTDTVFGGVGRCLAKKTQRHRPRDLIIDLGRYVIGHNPFDIESRRFELYQVEHNTGPVVFADGRNRNCTRGPSW